MSEDERRRLKILDVNDDEALQDVVKHCLEREGYEVITASNGLEGVETALREQPDLILMNYMMPVLDGNRATRRLREYPQMRDVPIILNTACDERMVKDTLMPDGFTDYFILPCSAREIIRLVKKYCPQDS